MRLLNISVACTLALLAAGAHAADAPIPASTFAKHFEYTGAALSPNGDYVSVLTPFEDRRGLSIIKLSGNYDRSMVNFYSAHETVAGAGWTDDHRLVVWKAIDIGTLQEPLLNGDVYAVDADAQNQTQIFGYVEDHGSIRSRLKDEGTTTFMRELPGTKGEALFYYSPWLAGNSSAITAVYRVDTHSGSRRLVESINDSVAVVADNAGVPRLISATDLGGNPYLRYRPKPDADWQALPKSLVGHDLWISAFETDNDHAYAWIDDKGEAKSLYRVDLAAGTRERIGGNEDQEPTHYLYSGYQGKPFAVIYNSGKPRVEYLDPTSEWSQLHAGLMKFFAGQLVEFQSFTHDNNKVLLYVYSDRHPGAYYLFDRTTRSPQMLFEVADWIDPAKMSPSRPIEFQNREGKTLYGVLTVPAGKTGPLATVVMPHGGPFGIHDEWGYDADAQFLASRGYAVLQVNYRGSAGRGHSFEASTYKQWGTGIQDDITDALRWAEAQNLVDAQRVCIFGTSFGGYSALMNPIRNPGTYRCAIGYSGVYDLPAMVATDAKRSKQMAAATAREIGSDEAELEAQSPSFHADAIDVPVLLIHGKSDRTAPIDQFNAMEAALKKAGKTYETLVKANEGHGFYDEKNQTEAYERMAAFLAKYNPAN